MNRILKTASVLTLSIFFSQQILAYPAQAARLEAIYAGQISDEQFDQAIAEVSEPVVKEKKNWIVRFLQKRSEKVIAKVEQKFLKLSDEQAIEHLDESLAHSNLTDTARDQLTKMKERIVAGEGEAVKAQMGHESAKNLKNLIPTIAGRAEKAGGLKNYLRSLKQGYASAVKKAKDNRSPASLEDTDLLWVGIVMLVIAVILGIFVSSGAAVLLGFVGLLLTMTGAASYG